MGLRKRRPGNPKGNSVKGMGWAPIFVTCAVRSALCRVGDAMFLTPGYRDLSQCFFTVPIPGLSHPIHVHAVFEPPKCASTTYRVTQINTDIVIFDRQAKPFHDAVFVDVKFAWERAIMVRFQDVFGDTKRVVLPGREVFEWCLLLSRSSL